MFDRRSKPNAARRFLNFLWPTIGWRRATSYMLHRLARLPGSAYSIAAGFACGAAVSFSPFVGLHFILGALWAWMIRANIVASAIGTAVGNPWTFPFIWVWIFEVGSRIVDPSQLSETTHEHAIKLDFSATFGNMLGASLDGDMDRLIDTAAPVFWPMLVGSVPTIIVVWLLFYFPLKKIVERYQNRRRRKRRAKGRMHSRGEAR